jgi:ATP-dependent Clp protease ATP-binding subunit ClpB
MGTLRQNFRPEFLNRVDEIVLFKPLLKDQLHHIIELMLDRGLRARLADRKIELELTGEAKDFIADAAYEPQFGARPLRRYLQNYIETPLAKELIAGRIDEGQRVTVDVQDGRIAFREAVATEVVQ